MDTGHRFLRQEAWKKCACVSACMPKSVSNEVNVSPHSAPGCPFFVSPPPPYTHYYISPFSATPHTPPQIANTYTLPLSLTHTHTDVHYCTTLHLHLSPSVLILCTCSKKAIFSSQFFTSPEKHDFFKKTKIELERKKYQLGNFKSFLGKKFGSELSLSLSLFCQIMSIKTSNVLGGIIKTMPRICTYHYQRCFK